jgi:proteasome lid subunit RPN8/RPN11
MSALLLPASLLKTLQRWSCDARPREACGFLLGTTQDARIEVRVVQLSTNLSASEDHFELDPAKIVAAEREARAHGLELVGFWHSHPRAEAVPSADDARGTWPGHACVIVGLRDVPFIRAWRLARGVLVEDRIELSHGAALSQEGPSRAETASISPLRRVTATIEP